MKTQWRLFVCSTLLAAVGLTTASCGDAADGPAGNETRDEAPNGESAAGENGVGADVVSTDAASNNANNDATHGEWKPRPQTPTGDALAKLPRDGGPNWNRLVFEESPYLLQHAANPVDWHPWGEEALNRARDEDKPIFVSIGYSTCHWCHVMEHESFEDESVAAYINEHFIPIKVDREERPDIDNIYMAAVQAITGRGGWPLNAWLTPDGRPFFAGTYFPKDDKYGRPGFVSLLQNINDAWQNNRQELLDGGDQVTARVRQQAQSRRGGSLTVETLEGCQERLASSFDAALGGFGAAPKFPRSHVLSFLLRDYARSGDSKSLEMVELTLDQMSRGGMADHLGGGFHRYSVDEKWLVPHFEKMLYDQAILARTYLEAYQATRQERYADVARGIFAYVLRDLHDPAGGFLSAEDADSEGEEGTFYVWRPEQVLEVLGSERGKRFNRVYDVTELGNFEHASSILNLKKPISERATEFGIDVGVLERELEESREKLLAVRSQRIRPGLDDKVLTAWNGLMISAFAYGSQVLDEEEYARIATRAANFVLQELRDENGRLLRRYRNGNGAIPGYIDDYAFFINSLIDVYETTFETRYLIEATRLAGDMNRLFADESSGGYFFQGTDGEALVVKSKEIYDGAIPSGNSVAALALLRLGDLTGNLEYTKQGEGVMDAFSGFVAQAPNGYTQFLIALDFAMGPSAQVVLAGDPTSNESRRMLRALHDRFIPNKVVAVRDDGKDGKELAALAPFVENQTSVDGKTTAYVCRNHACSLPTQDPAKMISLLMEATQ